MVIPRLVADYQCHNAESPLWHPQQQQLYWTDIPTGRMFRYDPKSDRSEQIYRGESVGAFTIQEDGSLLLFKARGAISRWQEGKETFLITELPEEKETRFNDVIADPQGRVFCGTMPTATRLGRLYRLDRDGTLTLLLEGIECSNGIAFSRDRQKMYYTDSPKREIYCFTYDEATGEISDRTIYMTTPANEGVPDGLTIDAEGYLWSARWDGHHLFRYTPDGEEVLRLRLPAKKVSSVTFGGQDCTDIFITTAGGENREENGEGAGGVYTLNLGIQGVPEFYSKIAI